MNTPENAGSSPSLRPRHLSREYAEQFQDQSVVDVYHLRPPYPEEAFSLLARLIDPDCRRVLDVGCGTGEIARRIVGYPSPMGVVDQVDAVDLSSAMIDRGKRLPGGAAPTLRWITGAVETVPLTPPYGLITAAASLHWMDWPIVLPRFAEVLTPNGKLAIILEQNSIPGVDLGPLSNLIREFSTNQEYQPFDLVGELVQRGLFVPEGDAWTEPILWEQSVDDGVRSIHSRNGFSQERMSPEAIAAFDSLATEILRAAFPSGIQLLSIQTRVVWGRPGRFG